MRRREFIRVFGGAAATWPLAARAQQPERDAARRRADERPLRTNRNGQARVRGVPARHAATGLGRRAQSFGSIIRWGGNDAKMRKNAAELVGYLRLKLSWLPAAQVMGPLMQISGTVPIVFLIVPDPVGAGYVNSLARPGGNATGFLLFEYSIGGKWLDLLKQIAPEVNRVAVLRDPAISAGLGQYGAVQSAAPSFGVEVSASQSAGRLRNRARHRSVCNELRVAG